MDNDVTMSHLETQQVKTVSPSSPNLRDEPIREEDDEVGAEVLDIQAKTTESELIKVDDNEDLSCKSVYFIDIDQNIVYYVSHVGLK